MKKLNVQLHITDEDFARLLSADEVEMLETIGQILEEGRYNLLRTKGRFPATEQRLGELHD